MSTFSDFRVKVQQGVDGSNTWLPLKQGKLGSSIYFGQGMYFLFGGLPGSGKTAVVDTMFVLEPYRWWRANKEFLDIKPHWIYRSMERSRELKIAKWTAYMMYMDHGIRIDVPTLMGWPNKLYTLTKEQINIIDSYKDFFDELEEHITIVDGSKHPTGVFSFAKEYALANGKMEKRDQYNSKYVPNNPNSITIHVTDHVGKITSEAGLNGDKAILDKHSEYMGELRDVYGMSIIDISQLNRGIEDTYRAVKTEIDVQPKDFKGTGDMYENADVVIGLMNPYKLQVFDYMGYDIKAFVNDRNYNRFRALKVIKNSYGIDDFRIGYQFLGENGLMVELPRAEKFNYDDLRKNTYIDNFRTT